MASELRRVTCLFKLLEASTNNIASVLSSENMLDIEWTAASQPASWPAHSCSEPTAAWRSCFIVLMIAFPIILRNTSPIPNGRTPGHLL